MRWIASRIGTPSIDHLKKAVSLPKTLIPQPNRIDQTQKQERSEMDGDLRPTKVGDQRADRGQIGR